MQTCRREEAANVKCLSGKKLRTQLEKWQSVISDKLLSARKAGKLGNLPEAAVQIVRVQE